MPMHHPWKWHISEFIWLYLNVSHFNLLKLVSQSDPLVLIILLTSNYLESSISFFIFKLYCKCRVTYVASTGMSQSNLTSKLNLHCTNIQCRSQMNKRSPPQKLPLIPCTLWENDQQKDYKELQSNFVISN